MIYLSVAESDAFSETFSKLRETLRSAPFDAAPLQPAPSIDEQYVGLRKHPGVHSATQREIKRDGVAWVNQLRQERHRRRVVMGDRLAHIRLRRDQLNVHAQQTQHAIDMQLTATDHHVASLQAMATRRLQVLLFECLGEIQKAVARAQQRVETQETSVDVMVATCELNHAWAIFAKRCEEHFNLSSVVDLPPKLLTANATYVANPLFQSWTAALAPFLSKHLDLPLAPATLASPELSITRILAVQTSRHNASPSKLPSHSNNKTRLIVPHHPQPLDNEALEDEDAAMATQYQSLHQLLGDVTNSTRHMKRTKGKSKTSCPQTLFPDEFTCTTPLSSSTIRWLPQVPHTPLQAPTNGCIYFCLEDYQARSSAVVDRPASGRQLSPSLLSLARIASPNLQQNAAVAQTEALAARYISPSPATATDFSGPFQIDQVFPQHHVVRASSMRTHQITTHNNDNDRGLASMHFAPANVSHLIQTATYVEMVGSLAPEHQTSLHLRYPPETIGSHLLQHLYVAVPASPRSTPTTERAYHTNNPLFESILRPITSDAIRVLISTYVVRDPKVTPDGGKSSLFSLYRPSFGAPGAAYCIVENPGFLLPTTTSASASPDGPSTLVVQYTTHTPSLPLHAPNHDVPAKPTSVLGSFCTWRSCLEEAVGTNRLCASHSRLESLLTSAERVQVLGSTGRSGSDTTAMAPAMEIRHIKHSSSLLEELLSQQLRTTLVSFLDKMVAEGSNRTLFGAANTSPSPAPPPPGDPSTNDGDEDALDELLQVERATTDEVKALVALGVYPTAELGLLRKVNPTHSPLQASQRKLMLLRTRRQEEEEKQGRLKGKRLVLGTSKSCPVMSKGLDQVSKLKKRRDGSKF